MNGPARELIKRICLEDGLYYFELNVDTKELVCIRHEKDPVDFTGNKAVLALFAEALKVKTLKEDIKNLKVDVECEKQRAAEWEDCFVALKKATGHY